MNLSIQNWLKFGLAGVAALAVWAVVADSAMAQTVARRPTEAAFSGRGFERSNAMQQYWQRREQASSRAPQVVVPPEPMTLAPRYATIIGPDGRSRTFQIEGPITVMPMRSRVVHFGANDAEGPVVWVPVEPVIRFGTNNPVQYRVR